jgi:molecular chaperone GrpE
VPRRKDENEDVLPNEQDETSSEEEGFAHQSEEPTPTPPTSDDPLEEVEDQDEDALTGEENETQALHAELERARAEGQEYLDGWQRARAEFANYRKRIERENQESYKRIAGDILCRYLGVIDDLELALRERPTEGDAATWADGIGIIHQKLISLLEAEGVEQIEAQGKQFDPNYHEALSHEENNEYEEGQVIEVIRQGYRLNDRVLRPALVRVAK